MSATELPGSSGDKPVFVDTSGRRRRTVRRVAVASSAVLAGLVGLVVAALLGAPVVPSALLPAPHGPDPAPVTAHQPAALPPAPGAVLATTAPSRHRPAEASNPAAAPGAASTTRTTAATVITTATPPAPTTTATQPGNPGHGHGKPTSVSTPPGHGH